MNRDSKNHLKNKRDTASSNGIPPKQVCTSAVRAKTASCRLGLIDHKNIEQEAFLPPDSGANSHKRVQPMETVFSLALAEIKKITDLFSL